MRADVVVLGAGIIGICVALHLQKRGRSVVLLDRRGAAEETSFGNAGLVLLLGRGRLMRTTASRRVAAAVAAGVAGMMGTRLLAALAHVDMR